MPTFLFTDIEGSTRLWEDHPEAMTVALARHDEILSGAVSRTNGRVLKTTGDGVVAVFDDAGEALGASVDAQRGLSDEPWQVGPIRVRMGVHLGETESRDGDFFGQVMNRAARIMASGHGGQVLLSGAVVDTASGRLPAGASVRDLGTHRLKDLTLPEHLYQLVHDDLQSEFPPLATLEARPHNLPFQTTEFLGRNDELAAIEVMLESPSTRLLTIAGPGGAGKTRLGLQAAAEQLDRFRDGVYFVDLSAERDPSSAYEAIIRSLGLTTGPGSDPLEVLTSRLRDVQMLLLLDNFEQVTAAGVGVSVLLQGSPGLKVIVTSRETLRVRAEHVFPVPPLSLPHPKAGLATIAESEAVQLFTERARAVQPSFALTEENAPTIAEICLRLDGLPLALELAAARLNVFSPPDLLARLRERLDILGAGGRDLPDRQRTLWGAIGWSYELLDEPERELFEVLAPFSPATLDAIESVASDSGLTDMIIDLLASLVDKSLVRAEEVSGTRHFSMLLMIKEFALGRLGENPDREDAVRRAHARYFTTRAKALHEELRGPGRAFALAQLTSDVGNLREAWRFWVKEGDLIELFGLIDPLWALHEAKGWYHAAIELANDTLGVLETADPSPELEAEELAIRTSLARALMAVGGYGPEVETAFLNVLDRLEGKGTPAQRFPVLRALTSFYMNQAEFEKSAQIGQELIALGEEAEDEGIRLEGHYVFGSATAFAGDLETGLPHLQKAIDLFDPTIHGRGRYRLGPSTGIVARTASGLILWQCGALEQAVTRVQGALDLARQLDHPYSLAYALYHNGFLALTRQRFEECQSFARELETVASENDYAVWETLAYVLEGASLTALGNPEEGLTLTERGVALYKGLTTPPIFWPLILNIRALVHAMAGNPETALDLIDEAIAIGSLEETSSPDFRMFRGDFLMMVTNPDVDSAEAAYESAERGARAGGLTLVELMALTRIVALRRATHRDPDRSDDLAALYATFAEGHGEADMRAARELIG